MTESRLGIWLVKRQDEAHYGEFESFVVVAGTEREARIANPAAAYPDMPYLWPVDPDLLIVNLIGFALADIPPGIIHSSSVEV